MSDYRRIVLLLAMVECALSLGGMNGTRVRGEQPSTLRIVAQIAGADELHISHRKAIWVHRSRAWPAEVQINGRAWIPRDQPIWTAQRGSPFLREDIDLAGAVLTKVRGRGQVGFGFGRNGLIIRFNDNRKKGAAKYEVLVTFADASWDQWHRQLEAASAKSIPEPSVSLSIQAGIDGSAVLVISPDRAQVVHRRGKRPSQVAINGQPWAPERSVVLPPKAAPFLPRMIDLSEASLTKVRGRGSVRLERDSGSLIVWLDDPRPGEDEYDIRVTVARRPCFRVVVQTDEPDHTAGAALHLLRHPASGGEPESVPGLRTLDHQGRAILFLSAGTYEWEIVHRPQPDVLVALKTGPVKIDASKEVGLQSISVRGPTLHAERQKLLLTDLGIRSIRPTGDISWSRTSKSPLAAPLLVLSRDQSYRVRAIGHAGDLHLALWQRTSALAMKRIAGQDSSCVRCSFRWHPQALPHSQAGAAFFFPDGRIEMPVTPTTLFLTNRRFSELSYWQRLPDGRKLAFYRRGYVLLAAPSDYEFALGGPLTAHASAAILTASKPGDPRAKRLWTHIGLRDPQGHFLNSKASKVGWKTSVVMKDGGAPPKYPLSQESRKRLGKLTDTVLLTASCRLDKPMHVELAPTQFMPMETPPFRTKVPPYMQWRTAAYLAKAERSMEGIAAVRGRPIPESYRVNLRWWLNWGAVGARGGISMPLRNMVGDFSWYTHPWAISHELLHGFGYGHDWAMNHVDQLVQERFRRFRWSVVDHPEFVPDEWPIPAANNQGTGLAPSTGD